MNEPDIQISLDPAWERATIRVVNEIRTVPFFHGFCKSQAEEYVLWLACALSKEMKAGVTFSTRAWWVEAFGMTVVDVTVTEAGDYQERKCTLYDVEQVPAKIVVLHHIEELRKLIQEVSK